MQNFKTGDKVILKTGRSPIMVIRGYDPKDGEDVTCEWFDTDQNAQEKSFHQDMVESYSPSDISVFTSGPPKNRFRY
jgi:uncharacterized protein YodC (DUF2158 family)